VEENHQWCTVYIKLLVANIYCQMKHFNPLWYFTAWQKMYSSLSFRAQWSHTASDGFHILLQYSINIALFCHSSVYEPLGKYQTSFILNPGNLKLLCSDSGFDIWKHCDVHILFYILTLHFFHVIFWRSVALPKFHNSNDSLMCT
jgi:hypothetical protein